MKLNAEFGTHVSYDLRKKDIKIFYSLNLCKLYDHRGG